MKQWNYSSNIVSVPRCESISDTNYKIQFLVKHAKKQSYLWTIMEIANIKRAPYVWKLVGFIFELKQTYNGIFCFREEEACVWIIWFFV